MDCEPPLVKIPSGTVPAPDSSCEPAAQPMRPAVHATRWRSTKVPATLWSKVSRLALTPETKTSASRAGITTGQLRWAA